MMSSRELILARLKSASWAESASSRIIIPLDSSAARGDIRTFMDMAASAGAQVEKVNGLA